METKSKFQVGQVWECRDPTVGMRRIDHILPDGRLKCSIWSPGRADHGVTSGIKSETGKDFPPSETRCDLVRMVLSDSPSSREFTEQVVKSLYLRPAQPLATDPSASRDRAHAPQPAFRSVPFDHFPDLEGWTMQKG